MEIKMVRLSEIVPYENNPRKNGGAVEPVRQSIKEFGFKVPMVLDRNNVIITGHTRYKAAQELGMKEVPVIYANELTDEQVKAFRLADNKTNEFSEWDDELLKLELDCIPDLDMSLFGFDISKDIGYNNGGNTGILSEKYIIPPVSIIDTRKGSFRDRDHIWESMINDRGESRMEKTQMLTFGVGNYENVSILSPTLAEIIFNWFTPEGEVKCFDCFAGDTVFGYVAGHYGAEFRGIELREEQVNINNSRAQGNVLYYCDDGRNVRKYIEDETQDLFFSCPPYFDLEVYSDLENDASNQKNYADFYAILDTAFKEAAVCLKPDRFAVVVCGDVRNKKTGEYYDFPGDIKNTFKQAGLKFYNEIILINSYGTAGIRAEQNMRSRKVTKVHQNILVFYKGDTKAIKNTFGAVDVGDVREFVNDGEDL